MAKFTIEGINGLTTLEFCHGTPLSIRLDFAMWSYSFKRIGPRSYGRWQRISLGNPPRRDWTPHKQPIVCPKCAFVFSFEGCTNFHFKNGNCEWNQ